ncbi:MAG: NAD-dependent epimerase/dehydratase family protein [Gemmatimonadetes bacterium]|nr:NAD-dependent epimerase/dehydratase family protein [Gemmatimonadota bacterium]
MTGHDPDKALPPLRDRSVLITGGAGFIGSSLAERLVEHNRVVLFDRTFEGQSAPLSRAWDHPNRETVEGDVLDAAALADVAAGADTVVHLAAIVGVKNVLERGRETIEVNFTGTSNLLKAVEGRRDLHRFVYFSTSEVFGMNSFRAGEETPTSIGSVSEARWTYSIAKLAGEHLVHTYHRELGLPTVIIRPFNVFGPLRLGDHAMLRFIVAALKGDDLEVHGDGTQIRSWCYIDDFVDALLRVLSLPQAVGETFNVGNPRNTVTIYELARRVIALLDSPSEVRFEAIDFSDIDVRVPRLQKAEELLGFRPSVELDEAILRTAAWYREHQEPAGRDLSQPVPAQRA